MKQKIGIYSINISKEKRDGKIKPGDRFVYLNHPVNGNAEKAAYPINIKWIKKNNGARHPYWQCPSCGTIAKKLYLANGVYVCRICSRFSYYSHEPIEVGITT